MIAAPPPSLADAGAKKKKSYAVPGRTFSRTKIAGKMEILARVLQRDKMVAGFFCGALQYKSLRALQGNMPNEEGFIDIL